MAFLAALVGMFVGSILLSKGGVAIYTIYNDRKRYKTLPPWKPLEPPIVEEGGAPNAVVEKFVKETNEEVIAGRAKLDRPATDYLWPGGAVLLGILLVIGSFQQLTEEGAEHQRDNIREELCIFFPDNAQCASSETPTNHSNADASFT